jgi:hypothetical protein
MSCSRRCRVKRFAQPALENIDVRLDCAQFKSPCGQLTGFPADGQGGETVSGKELLIASPYYRP